jgi:hypothetical protein
MSRSKALSSSLALGLLGLLGVFVGCSGSVKNADGCSYAGKSYAVGDSFPDSDGCNQCSCAENGSVQCTLVACAPIPDSGTYCSVGGQRYTVGEQVSNDGCNTCSCLSSGDIACTHRACPPDGGPSCTTLNSELSEALALAQKCTSAAQCGQPITGSSCGCTRDLVARKDADLAPYQTAKAKLAELGCDTGGSTCDCPNADGFACINGRCAWNYVDVEPQPDPACQPYDAGQLCVRGTQTADGEILSVGDPLRVTVRSTGCLSSSCSKVVAASCMIASNTDFDVTANFCVADTSKPGEGCTADCGTAKADCSFGQPLTAGEHQVKIGSIAVGFQVPSKLPFGGLCAGTNDF